MATTLSTTKNTEQQTVNQQWHFRPYQEGDIPAIVEMIAACAAVDSFDKQTSIEELTENFAQPLSEPLKQIIIVDGPKQPGLPEGAHLAHIRILSYDDAEANQRLYQMRVRIRPAVRGTGIEQVLAEQAIAHIRAAEANADLPERESIQLLAISREEDAISKGIYDSIGLKQIRYSWTMEKSLADKLPTPKEIEGVTIRNYNPPDDTEGARIAYNSSFIDHFEFHAMTPEMWDYVTNRPNTRPKLSWLAEVKDGENAGSFAGFCICEITDKQNERTGKKEGWIGLLGTTREWRGVGLGKSLLLRGLHSLQQAGMETALLGVDSESLTGANRLYESVGFTIRNFEILYKTSLADIA